MRCGSGRSVGVGCGSGWGVGVRSGVVAPMLE